MFFMFKRFKNNTLHPFILSFYEFFGVSMPILNGIKTLQLIKEKYPEIKVVMFSSQSDNLTVQEVKEIGANSFVDKYNHEILMDTVIQVHKEHYSYNAVFQPKSKRNFI